MIKEETSKRGIKFLTAIGKVMTRSLRKLQTNLFGKHNINTSLGTIHNLKLFYLLLQKKRKSVTFHSLLVTRNKIWSLLVAEVARCKKSIVTCCRSWLLQEITHYSLQISLITRYRSCSLQKITCYSLQKLLVVINHSLPVAKFARYLLQKLLVAKSLSLLVAKVESLFATF